MTSGWLKDDSESIKQAFRKHSESIQRAFREHSENIHRTLREHSEDTQRALKSTQRARGHPDYRRSLKILCLVGSDLS